MGGKTGGNPTIFCVSDANFWSLHWGLVMGRNSPPSQSTLEWGHSNQVNLRTSARRRKLIQFKTRPILNWQGFQTPPCLPHEITRSMAVPTGFDPSSLTFKTCHKQKGQQGRTAEIIESWVKVWMLINACSTAEVPKLICPTTLFSEK